MKSHNKSDRRLVLVTDDYADKTGKAQSTLYADTLAGKYGGNARPAGHNRRRGMKRLAFAAGATALATAAGIFSYNKITDTDKVEEPTVILGSHVVTADDAAGKLKIAQDMIDESDGRITVSAPQLLPYMDTQLNSDAGTVQDPSDTALQLGEQVVLEVPESQISQIIGSPPVPKP